MAAVNCFSSLSGETLRNLFKEIDIDKDYEGFVYDCLGNMLFYNSIQSSKFNSSQCDNLRYAIVSKLSAYLSCNWRFEIPREEVYFRRNRAISVSEFAFNLQGTTIMQRAWKEIYRVVKEAEEYLKLCSQDNWWITAITLANTGEAYALHIHDLAWSVLCLDFHFLFLKYRGDGSQSDVYTGTASRKISDFRADMSNLSRIHDEYQDRRQMISIFQQWLKAFKETAEGTTVTMNMDEKDRVSLNTAEEATITTKLEEQNKVKAAKFLLSAKLQATIRSKPAITVSRVSPWLQIDPDDLVLTNGSLGHGSSGEVLKGSWLGVNIAVKDIQIEGSDIDPLLQDEIADHAQLQSPFVVQLIGVCVKDGHCYLVMELVDSSLDKWLQDRLEMDRPPLPLEVALDIMLQLSRAMEYLHSQRIMHRDLKASNVLIQPSAVPEFREQGYGRIKLCDFGNASLRLYSFRSPDFTQGTCQWRAPEVFQYPQQGWEKETNSLMEYTYKADVYSFAMTCYEILTGRMPFEGVRPKDVYGKVVQGERPHLPPTYPPVLVNYIKKCWDTDPQRRPGFTDVSNFMRYMKLLIMRMNDSNTSDCDFSSAICEDFDKNELVRSGEEEGLDERAPSSEEEKLIIRALDGDFPEFFQPRPLSQQRASPMRPENHETFVSLPDYIQRYSYEEVQDATHGFSKEVLGSSSSIWKGVLNSGKQVAVKETSINEIDMLGQLHHPNVARLCGVSEHRETLKMYAVYDEMAVGSLGALLFRPNSVLNWNIRRKIAIGIARFLVHLHEHHGNSGKRGQKLLHLGVNSTKIYLDERFTPKFCGFESVALLDSGYHLKGLEQALQFEEWENTQDFGIILLELLTGCKWGNMAYSLQSILRKVRRGGTQFIPELLDKTLQSEVDAGEALRWVKLALWCFAVSPSQKPTMNRAVSPSQKPTMNRAVLVMTGHRDLSELPISVAHFPFSLAGEALARVLLGPGESP